MVRLKYKGYFTQIFDLFLENKKLFMNQKIRIEKTKVYLHTHTVGAGANLSRANRKNDDNGENKINRIERIGELKKK